MVSTASMRSVNNAGSGEFVIRDARSNEILLTEADANARKAADATAVANRLAEHNRLMEEELQRLRRQLDERQV